eukprot:CAMPEP_0195506824 /NCGR_PEP_ID=MMETSP0794_2-20130614/384_1 /TAXON_ID=515487 /ORGANISM="Stephanopyxis turris, Strain CCMP 815" /LENGTH=117 /DNA_ID=CAMNT_0040633273 /DNA_START=114 /DNA_END=467 /DNA_ORIENTATION=-
MTLEDSVNLARRLSAKNASDLTQEPYNILTEEECKVLTQALKGEISKLPKECRRFVGANRKVVLAKRATTPQEDANIAFAGMHSGQAAAAKANRAGGRPSNAVLQRRLTNTHNPKPK